MTSPVAERLATVRASIRDACRLAGRDPADVTLVAVSKLQPVQAIRDALAAGQVDFGENYAQHLRDKAAELGTTGIRWHFIGRLQENKVKFVAGVATLFHALDDVSLCDAFARRLPDGARQPVLVQVHTGGETSKGGVGAAEALDLCARVAEHPAMELRGLMTVPPPTPNADDGLVRACFDEVAELARQGRSQGLPLHTLSMGMSADLHLAIGAGSTLVRVGTAVFGERATR